MIQSSPNGRLVDRRMPTGAHRGAIHARAIGRATLLRSRRRAFLTQPNGKRRAGPVFLSPAGKAWTVPNLSRTYSRLRDLAGLPRDLVLYLARHECGTKVCRQKGIEYARRLLGHMNISTTQRYMHLDDNELADAQDLIE